MSKFKELMEQARQRESEPPDEDEDEDEAPGQQVALAKEVAKAPAKELPTNQVPLLEADAAPQPARPPDTVLTGTSKVMDNAMSSESAPTNDAESPSRGRGRPPGPAGGKRSHPDYEQVSAYLPRQTYREVKLALLQNEVTTGDKQEFSTLVAELLSDWLKNRKTK